MKLNVDTLFEGFKPQNVINLFLHSMKHSYLLTDIEYFDTTIEEYKFMYPVAISDTSRKML